MKRTLLGLALFFGVALPAVAEEITLKDGTKIVGHMVTISGDKIEVETSYGKMSVKRSDILTIAFPENDKDRVAPSPPSTKPELKVEESLDATQYVNKTASFSLVLPLEWKINPELRASAGVMAALSSRDSLRYLVVDREVYSGSIESYKGLVEIQAKRGLDNYERLSESPISIDGKMALLMTYRGTLPKANNLPVQFLVAIISSGGSYYHISAWCVEPLFNETQPGFEKIITSFHSTADPSMPTPAPKP